MFSESVSLVRSALARIVSSVAKLSFPQGTWPQLMQVQARCCLHCHCVMMLAVLVQM